MAELKAKERKISRDGAKVVVYRDARDNWYVGRLSGLQFEPRPPRMLRSREACRRWADARFPGGRWERIG
jgi:hypothetical protein